MLVFRVVSVETLGSCFLGPSFTVVMGLIDGCVTSWCVILWMILFVVLFCRFVWVMLSSLVVVVVCLCVCDVWLCEVVLCCLFRGFV